MQKKYQIRKNAGFSAVNQRFRKSSEKFQKRTIAKIRNRCKTQDMKRKPPKHPTRVSFSVSSEDSELWRFFETLHGKFSRHMVRLIKESRDYREWAKSQKG